MDLWVEAFTRIRLNRPCTVGLPWWSFYCVGWRHTYECFSMVCWERTQVGKWRCDAWLIVATAAMSWSTRWKHFANNSASLRRPKFLLGRTFGASDKVPLVVCQRRTDRSQSTKHMIVTWLILPVVIRSSQRLSHACVSINKFILWNCERLIISVIVYLIIPYYLDNRSNSRANTCNKTRLAMEGLYLLDISQPCSHVFGES